MTAGWIKKAIAEPRTNAPRKSRSRNRTTTATTRAATPKAICRYRRRRFGSRTHDDVVTTPLIGVGLSSSLSWGAPGCGVERTLCNHPQYDEQNPGPARIRSWPGEGQSPWLSVHRLNGHELRRRLLRRDGHLPPQHLRDLPPRRQRRAGDWWCFVQQQLRTLQVGLARCREHHKPRTDRIPW